MSFQFNYLNSPPSVSFTSETWHPNVYSNGKICISILHPPGEDPNDYELASGRWTPVHTVKLMHKAGWLRAGKLRCHIDSSKTKAKPPQGDYQGQVVSTARGRPFCCEPESKNS